MEQMLRSSTHPSRVIEPIKDPKDIEKIRKSLSKKSRDLLLFDLATQTGLRAKELLKLKAKDLFDLQFGDDLAATLEIEHNKPFSHVMVAAAGNKPHEWILGWSPPEDC